MLVIEVQFLAGRYHSTRWGSHVNEGQVEWPPFPWRLLRSLISVWHTKCQMDVEAQDLSDILEALQSGPPSYALPRAGEGHTRHYMPVGLKSEDGEMVVDTTKVFDSFMAPDAPLYIVWPDLELSDHLESCLRVMLERITYLGRAESLVSIGLTDFSPTLNLVPTDGDDIDLQVLRPMESNEYLRWREAFVSMKVESAIKEKADRGKKASLSNKETDRIESAVPACVRDCLEMTSDDIRSGGWNQPPGSIWSNYRFTGFKSGIGTGSAMFSGVRPTLARFLYVGPQPASLLDSITVSDSVHRALVRMSDGSPTFTGCDDEGLPLKGHLHAYVFCESIIEGTAGRRAEITHVNVFRSQGFDREDLIALQRLAYFWRLGEQRLLLISVGEHEDVGGRRGSPSFLRTSTWISRTPFIGTRHPKTNRSGLPKLDPEGYQLGSPEHDLLRLLELEGLPPAKIVRMEETKVAGRAYRWNEYRQERRTSRKHPVRGAGFMIEFDEPVQGPILLGLENHFGMGHFIGFDANE